MQSFCGAKLYLQSTVVQTEDQYNFEAGTTTGLINLFNPPKGQALGVGQLEIKRPSESTTKIQVSNKVPKCKSCKWRETPQQIISAGHTYVEGSLHLCFSFASPQCHINTNNKPGPRSRALCGTMCALAIVHLLIYC